MRDFIAVHCAHTEIRGIYIYIKGFWALEKAGHHARAPFVQVENHGCHCGLQLYDGPCNRPTSDLVEGRPGQSTSIDSLVVVLSTVPTILQKLPLNRESHGLILLGVYKPDRENIFLSRGRWRLHGLRVAKSCNFSPPLNPLTRNEIT